MPWLVPQALVLPVLLVLLRAAVPASGTRACCS
jgi:hypothetical protein